MSSCCLLYEGLAKLFIADWSSYNFLLNARWILSGFFHWIANNPALLKIVDILNVWGLILVGLGLFLGIFTRVASAAGILLLAFYYVASPPLLGMDVGVPVEGHYLVVNKNLIELMALILLLVVFGITLVVLGELLPRAWGRDHPYRLAYRLAPLLEVDRPDPEAGRRQRPRSVGSQ